MENTSVNFAAVLKDIETFARKTNELRMFQNGLREKLSGLTEEELSQIEDSVAEHPETASLFRDLEPCEALLGKYSPTFAEDVKKYSYDRLSKAFRKLDEKAKTANEDEPWVFAWDFNNEELCAGFDNLTTFFLRNPAEFEKFLQEAAEKSQFDFRAAVGTALLGESGRHDMEACVAWLVLYDPFEFDVHFGEAEGYTGIPTVDVDAVHEFIVEYFEKASSGTVDFGVLKGLVERINEEESIFTCYEMLSGYDDSEFEFDEEQAREEFSKTKRIVLDRIAEVFASGSFEHEQEKEEALGTLLSDELFTESCDAAEFFRNVASSGAGQVGLSFQAMENLADMVARTLSETPSSLVDISRALRECFSESLEKFIDHKEAASSIEKLTRTLAAAAADVSENGFPQL